MIGSRLTVYGYDELGNEIMQTDAAGHSTQFQYDALGRKIGRTLPGGQTETFGYDADGNLAWQTNFSGVVITNQYDVDNRLTNCSAPGYHTSYAYGPTGLRTNMVDASGATVYTYDGQNRLTNKVVAWNGGPTVALNYRYDALGTLTSLWSSTANGVTNGYQYDLLGRLTNVLAGGLPAAGYGYDMVGNLQSLRYANGVTNLCQYDARNRLTNQVWRSGGVSLASFGYTVAPTGNRTALAENVNGTTLAYNWAYDYLYRMTGESLGGVGTVNYGFDAVGNRTSRQSTIPQIPANSAAYTANDWLASDTYDTNGNTTVSGTTSYQYDALNHLTNVNNGRFGGDTITYDGDGNRVMKMVQTLGGVTTPTTFYLVDDRNPSGYAQVMEEYRFSKQTATLNRVYNYGLALISQRQVASGTVSYYGSDGHGSTRFLTDANGNVTDTYTFDAFGLLIASSGAGTLNNYLYCGQQFDSDLGFYYLRARYYKPDSGRFWTMDTYEGNSEDPLSLHKYLYAQNNPVNGIDPTGFYTQDFGTAAHLVIGWAYESTHPGAIVNPDTGVLGTALKPDIIDPPNRCYSEIKPLSFWGIPGGIQRMMDYDGTFGRGTSFNYHRLTTWPRGIAFTTVTGHPIAYFNLDGIIFYTDVIGDVKALIALNTVQNLYKFLRGEQVWVTTVKIVANSMAKNVEIGAEADLEDTEGVAAMDDEIAGAPL